METIQIWLLVLVVNSEMVEQQTYDTRWHCMLVGSWAVEASIKGGEEDHPLNGFFCDPQEPEPVAQVTPVCLAPTRECS